MILLAAAAPALWGQSLALDAPPGPLQVDYYPKDGARVLTNPPALRPFALMLRVCRPSPFTKGGLSSEAAVLAASFDANGRALGKLEVR